MDSFNETPELNKIYNCKAEELLPQLDNESVDLIVTSPPYGDLRSYHGFEWNFEFIAQDSYRVLKPGGVLVWVVGDSFVNGSESLTSFEQALYFKKTVGFNMHQRIIWEKESLPTKRPKAYLPDFEDIFVFSKGEPNTFNPIMRKNNNAGQRRRRGHSGSNGFEYSKGFRVTPEMSMLTNVQKISVGGGGYDKIDHPAMFPEKLAERHILTWSNPGDLVLDYFMGSGTVAKMARINNRNYLGCDISLEYCELARQRLALPFTPNFLETMPIEKPVQESLI